MIAAEAVQRPERECGEQQDHVTDDYKFPQDQSLIPMFPLSSNGAADREVWELGFGPVGIYSSLTPWLRTRKYTATARISMPFTSSTSGADVRLAA